jgi:hypothetical protein
MSKLDSPTPPASLLLVTRYAAALAAQAALRGLVQQAVDARELRPADTWRGRRQETGLSGQAVVLWPVSDRAPGARLGESREARLPNLASAGL